MEYFLLKIVDEQGDHFRYQLVKATDAKEAAEKGWEYNRHANYVEVQETIE